RRLWLLRLLQRQAKVWGTRGEEAGLRVRALPSLSVCCLCVHVLLSTGTVRYCCLLTPPSFISSPLPPPFSPSITCSHRKCLNLVRDPSAILQTKSLRKTPRSEGATDSTPQQASPLRPRRFTLGPTRGGGRKRDHDGLSVHLQWPWNPDITGVPVYSTSSGTESGRTLNLCKTCGSAGNVEMVTCVVCCQMFHTFCAGGASLPLATKNLYTCSLCVTCDVCGEGDNCVTCTSCDRWFHKACMSEHRSYVGGRGTWRCVAVPTVSPVEVPPPESVQSRCGTRISCTVRRATT
ncbi:hypothetical protein GBAR_LOCUS21156, partial [Geodia barretti]